MSVDRARRHTDPMLVEECAAHRSSATRELPAELRFNPAGTLDAVVAHGAHVHLERTSSHSWSLVIESGGKLVQVWLGASRHVRGDYEVTVR